MRIYSIIEQLEETIENSPRPKIGSSAGKRIVEIDELHDILGDLKVTIPEDIRRANSVMLQAENMINNAADHARELVENAQHEADTLLAASNEKSEQILNSAKSEYERLVSEDEIYQEAQRRAKLLAKKAEYNAGVVFDNAKVYADEVMADLDRFLHEYRQQIAANRRDLDARARNTNVVPQEAAPVAQPMMQQPQQPMQQPAGQQPMQQPMAGSAQAQQQQRPVAPAPVFVQPQQPQAKAAQPEQMPRGRQNAAPQPPQDPYLVDEEDDLDEAPKKSLFGGLFKRKKKDVFEDDDFSDDFE
ncbi:MAG: hypothetical protein Q4E65_01400 [Clostridia bacterium]|nr:hypothetical protein [Clostridia bacterium]